MALDLTTPDLLPKNETKAEKSLLSPCYHPFNSSAELGWICWLFSTCINHGQIVLVKKKAEAAVPSQHPPLTLLSE